MKAALRFTLGAKADIDQAAQWYASQRTGLDAEFLAELGEMLEWIQRHPRTPALISRTLRLMKLNRFPYVISYRFNGKEVIVVRVVHGKRHPKQRMGSTR